MLLCETKVSDKKTVGLERLTTHMIHHGYSKVDNMCINKKGNVDYKAGDGTRYILKQWFLGRECDVKNEREVLEAVRKPCKNT